MKRRHVKTLVLLTADKRENEAKQSPFLLERSNT
jgi:hypothetical protein